MRYHVLITGQISNIPLLYRGFNRSMLSCVCRLTMLASFCITCTIKGYCQPGDPPIHSYSISRSCLGASGATQSITTSNKNLNVSQSIGQAGVIGTYHREGYTVLQGYQQPFRSDHKFKIIHPHQLKAVVYPNPFHESIDILIEEHIEGQVYVYLSDMLGTVIYSQRFADSQRIQLTLTDIPVGIYVIKVEADGRRFLTKQIKQ